MTAPVARDLTQLRVLLVHDWLYTWAGAERCLDEIAGMLPQADIVAGFVTDGARALSPVAARARETWAAYVPGARTKHRWFLPLHALAFSSIDTRGYDLVVSLSHAFSKSVRASNGAPHVCYCFSPPRYLWDLQDAYDAFASPLQRLALRSAASAMRALDARSARGVDRFVAISRHVSDRIRRYYGRDSEVVYPPVRKKGPAAAGHARETFLLTLGRLVPYKRVDLAIQAAEQLKVKLVVAGDGPDRARLEAMAGSHTQFLGEVSEEEAARLLSTCAAFVFCAEEDFGIAPVEANAHGAPVVAFGRGAATETMEEGVGAVFFEEQEPGSVAAAIERCLSRTWDADVMMRNAARFSPERFRDGIRGALSRAVEARSPR